MTEPTVDDLLRNHSRLVRELTLRTCDLVRSVLPNATEKVHLGWKNIQFGTGPKMADVVFGVAPLKERVNLYLSGADLPDPMGLLQGTGKAMRHVKITSPEDLESPALYGLLQAAVEAHGRPAAERAEAAGAPPEGYRAYGSRTVHVPVEKLFAAWTEESLRNQWLGEGKLTVRGTTPGKSLRARWEDDTPLDVRFAAKGDHRSEVSVDHRRLPDPDAAARMKRTWKESLDRLRELLEA